MRSFFCAAALLVLVSLPPAVRADVTPASPVRAEEQAGKITLANDRIALTVDKASGQIVSLRRIASDGKEQELGSGKTALYFDANAEVDTPPPGSTPPKKGYHRLDGTITNIRLAVNTAERAEVVLSAKPNAFFPFFVDLHYTLQRGDSGFYAYAVYRRPAGLPAGTLWQTRFVVRTAGSPTFDRYVVDSKHIEPIPTGEVTKTLADATFELADGSVKTKYMQSVYWADHLAYGTTGPGVGVWAITPSPEFLNGGPIKQGQTVHDNVVLRVMQSVHFGASPLHFTQGEEWQKVYGPIFFYVNSGTDPKTMLADAQARQRTEAQRWPYSWVNNPAYGRERSTVIGRLRRSDGGSVRNAWVILAAPGSDWPTQGKDRLFWTRADAEGSFTLPKVAPGRYTLYASGADQPEDFTHDGVTVAAGQPTRLGDLAWKPVTHGRRLWQIGVFDRSAGEFRNGEDAREYQMFSRYPEQFPEDVTFTVGQSDPVRDWNYAQWTFYSKRPTWTIRFRNDGNLRGKATLTLGFASAQPMRGDRTSLQVKVNGTEVDTIRLPKTGTAGYRGGVQDSQYNVRYLVFDAALLKPGWNEITLGHTDALPFPSGEKVETGPIGQGIGQVMYDALRLEIAPGT